MQSRGLVQSGGWAVAAQLSGILARAVTIGSLRSTSRCSSPTGVDRIVRTLHSYSVSEKRQKKRCTSDFVAVGSSSSRTKLNADQLVIAMSKFGSRPLVLQPRSGVNHSRTATPQLDVLRVRKAFTIASKCCITAYPTQDMYITASANTACPCRN